MKWGEKALIQQMLFWLATKKVAAMTEISNLASISKKNKEAVENITS